jgi:FMN-dependent oxidoreductase (nitrilotriacetate monooxygenase family)
MSTLKPVRFNAFQMNTPSHQSPGLWRHPRSTGAGYTGAEYWVELARLLEAGGFDAIFLADVLGAYDVYGGSHEAALKHGVQVPLNDPMALAPLIAHATSRLGIGITAAVSYEHPYTFARRMSTLDHLSGGRIGWNIVTGYLDSAARNLGQEQQLGHDARYDLADEYLDVVYKLWEKSWEDGAVLRDRVRGVYTDPARVHPIGHQGKYYSVPASTCANRLPSARLFFTRRAPRRAGWPSLRAMRKRLLSAGQPEASSGATSTVRAPPCRRRAATRRRCWSMPRRWS